MFHSMLVVETNPYNTIITNTNPNCKWLTVSGKSVAANVSIMYIFIHIEQE